MSILLDALKKASEEKKAKDEGPQAASVGSVEIKESFVEKKIEEIISPMTQKETIEPEKIVLNLESDEKIKKEQQPSIVFPDAEEVPLVMAIEEDLESVLEKKPEKKGVNQLFEEEVAVNHVNESAKADNADWSLSQIPGYQQYNPIEQDQKKSKKILGFFSFQNKEKSKEKKNKSLRVFFFIGLFLVFLFAIVFFALFYYDSQLQGQDRDLMRYHLKSVQKNNVEVNNRSHLNDKTTNRQSEQATENIKDDANHTALACLTPDTDKKLEEVNENANKSSKLDKLKPKAKTPSKIRDKATTKKPKKVLKKLKNNKIIIKKQIENEIEKLAFDAYQRGNLTKAKTLYSQALDKRSDNILALSGMAAIATKQGEISSAIKYYKAVLSTEPTNKMAQSALISLRSSSLDKGYKEKVESEIIKDPNNPVLKFALGNYFAKNKDWLAAQKQFFSASSLEPSNQNYALNLAVSMDRIGMYSQALNFYQRALTLSKIQGASFNVTAVNQRINVLSEHIKADVDG